MIPLCSPKINKFDVEITRNMFIFRNRTESIGQIRFNRLVELSRQGQHITKVSKKALRFF